MKTMAKSLLFYAISFIVALVPTLLFASWLREQNWDIKVKISAWDPFVKTMAIAGAIIVGLASLERFFDQRRQELLKDYIERNEARTVPFTEAIHTFSTIAVAAALSGADEAKAVTSFWRLYWGELVLFGAVAKVVGI